jgi:hypothetical protein
MLTTRPPKPLLCILFVSCDCRGEERLVLFLHKALAGLMVVIYRLYVFCEVGTVLKCYLDCLETSKDSVSLAKNIPRFCYSLCLC